MLYIHMSDEESSSESWVMHVFMSAVAWDIRLLARAISLKYKYNYNFKWLSSITGTVI